MFKFFYILNLSIGEPYYKEGTMLKLICATKCSMYHIHPQFHSQDSQHFTLTPTVLPGAAVLHLDRGTATLEPWHYHDLSDCWKAGGYLYFSLPLQCLLSSPTLVQTDENKRVLISLSSIGALQALKHPLLFHHLNLREKAPKLN